MAALRGVNLAWFFDAYGHDFAPNAVLGTQPEKINPMQIYRPLLKARERGFEAVHLSLCEAGEGILLDGHDILGVHPMLVESIAIIQECASLCGLKIYWTLLDGHSFTRCGETVTRAILSGADATAQFAERVAIGIMRRLDPKITMAVEVVNEPEALIAANDASLDFSRDTMRSAIRIIADAIRSERSGTIVTAGAHMSALAELWRDAPRLDAIDIHLETETRLPSRGEILSAIGNPASAGSTLPIIAGAICETASIKPTDDTYSAVFRPRLADSCAVSR
jgi:hypothetical protein